MDLRGEQGVTAIAHELSHLVLADRFGGHRPPPWADEGIAVLADSTTKQGLHQRDLHLALHERSLLRVGELLVLDACPAGKACATFYGQSASLAAFLVAMQGPQCFVDFVEQAMSTGHDRALRQVYNIAGTPELERLWHAHLAAANQAERGLVATKPSAPPGDSIQRSTQ